MRVSALATVAVNNARQQVNLLTTRYLTAAGRDTDLRTSYRRLGGDLPEFNVSHSSRTRLLAKHDAQEHPSTAIV